MYSEVRGTGVIWTHFIYICIPALTTLKIGTPFAEKFWCPLNNKIISLKLSAFDGLLLYFMHLINVRNTKHKKLQPESVQLWCLFNSALST